MSKRDKSDARTSERTPADGIPDPDSLQMDDRGTRIYRGKPGEHVGATLPDDGPENGPENGNYIGDPIKSDETIRAGDEADDEVGGEQWLPASDAPTIIRDVRRDQ